MILTAVFTLGFLVTQVAASTFGQTVLESDEDFAEYRIPQYPKHAVRIRRQNNSLCDAGSPQYTGWIDVDAKHFFFWYIESLHTPENDPLNLWMTGGPGCSGMIGMLLELGPCLIHANGTGTYRNPFSWTKNSSMIFIDQPAGTGFSYVDDGVDLPDNSFSAALDTHVFLLIFYTIFPHLQNVPFHISGESYGGHYVPTVAAEIVKHNSIHNGMSSSFRIPLKSIMVGDGYVSPLDTTYGYYETLCTTKPGVDTPIFNKTRCEKIATALPRCVYLHEACYAYPDPIICHAAGDFCTDEITALFFSESGEGGRDPFDITRTCEVDQYCYKAVLQIQDYMNTPSVWSALRVPLAISNFSIMSFDISNLFERGNDGYVNIAWEVGYLLNNGVDVLIYNGNLDLVCNTAGNLRWAEKLAWSGQAEFVAKNMRPWYTKSGENTVMAGTMKEAHGIGSQASKFSFVTVDGAGHMVPLDKPEIAQNLIGAWLFNRDI